MKEEMEVVQFDSGVAQRFSEDEVMTEADVVYYDVATDKYFFNFKALCFDEGEWVPLNGLDDADEIIFRKGPTGFLYLYTGPNTYFFMTKEEYEEEVKYWEEIQKEDMIWLHEFEKKAKKPK